MKLLGTMLRVLSGRTRQDISEPTRSPVGPWACQNAVVPIPTRGPLMTELLATAQHTRHLAWLGARESYAEEYRFVARSLILDIHAGYQAVTYGTGTLEDLLIGLVPSPDDTGDDAPTRGHAA